MNTTLPRVLSVIPPMTQLNTPYPSTAYLTGFLRARGVTATQVDLALGLILDLLSPAGLQAVREVIEARPGQGPLAQGFALHFDDYAATLTQTLNAGFKRGGVVSICRGEGSAMQVVDLTVFGPKDSAGVRLRPCSTLTPIASK